MRITYQIAGNLPPGTEGMVLWLAEQLLRSFTGDSCQLPERVTSITRQGVSWTMIDTMDFLDKGLTGMARIDQWIALIRRLYPPVSIIDPIRSERLTSFQCDLPPSGPVDARPTDVDLHLYEGDDFFMDLVVTNSDGSPAPVGTPLAQIRDSVNGVVLATFQTTVEDNTIHLHLPGVVVTEALVGVWDCQVTDAQGHVATLVAGSVTTTAEVSVGVVTATAATLDWTEPAPAEPTPTTHIDWGET